MTPTPAAHGMVYASIAAALLVALAVGCAPPPTPGDGRIFPGDAGDFVEPGDPDAGEVAADAGPQRTDQQTCCAGSSSAGCPAQSPPESSPCSFTGSCSYCASVTEPTRFFHAVCIDGTWSTDEIACDPAPRDAGPPDAGAT